VFFSLLALSGRHLPAGASRAAGRRRRAGQLPVRLIAFSSPCHTSVTLDEEAQKCTLEAASMYARAANDRSGVRMWSLVAEQLPRVRTERTRERVFE
jgi:hypothetical protein